MDSKLALAIFHENTTIVALSTSTGIMAPWLLPVTVGVTMLIFLMISFAIHHRQFLKQRRRSLMFYVVHGQRVASPSIPSKDLVPPPGNASSMESAEDASQLSPRRLTARLLEIFKTKSSPSASANGDVSEGKDGDIAMTDLTFGQNEPEKTGLSSMNCMTLTPLSSLQGRPVLKGRPFVVTTLSGILTKANLKPSDLMVAYQSCDDVTKIRERHVHVTSTATQHEDTNVPSSDLGEPGRDLIGHTTDSAGSKVNNETNACFHNGRSAAIRVSREICFVEKLSSDILEDTTAHGNVAVITHDYPSMIRHPISLTSTTSQHIANSERMQSLNPVIEKSGKTVQPSDVAVAVVSHFENNSGVHSNNTHNLKCHHAIVNVESSPGRHSSHLKTETVGSLATMKEVTSKLRAVLSGSRDVRARAKTLESSECTGCDTCDIVLEILGELSEDDCNNINEFLGKYDHIGQNHAVTIVSESVSGDGASQLPEVSGRTFGLSESENNIWADSSVQGHLAGSLTSFHDVVQ